MKRFLATAVAAGLFCAGTAQAAPMPFVKLADKGFSSRFHLTTVEKKSGKTVGEMDGRMWGMHRKMRMEMETGGARSTKMSKQQQEMMSGMGNMVILTDTEAKVGYMLMAGQKTYSELDLSDEHGKQSKQDWWGRDDFELTDLGGETVDGHPCRKARGAWPKTADEAAGSVTLWLAKDLHDFPVRVQPEKDGDNQLTFTYKDVKLGPVDPSLFKVPADYKKMEGMGGMPGGRKGKPGMDGDPKTMDTRKLIEEMKKKYGK